MDATHGLQTLDANAAAPPGGPVNSHDDFSPLREIVVGHPFHLDYADDVSTRLFYPQVPESDWRSPGIGTAFAATPHAALRDELWEDLNGFIEILESLDVTVRQPDVVDSPPVIRTPDWEVTGGHCTMIRDSVLVIGDHVIETPPLVRSRYFETHSYQTLLYEYFRSGARWTVAPRPRMRDTDFDYAYVLRNGWNQPIPANQRHEIMFDAPQVLRLGEDLVFNCSTQNHVLGAQWLQRTLGDDYRVHPVKTGFDDHLDCVLIALRPGTLLVHDNLDPTTLPPFLAEWEMIRYRPAERDCARHGLPLLASPAIFMNVLSIDDEQVLVDDREEELIAMLERRGFTPIPCRWRHGRLIGGGFHCMTLDVRRDGPIMDYKR